MPQGKSVMSLVNNDGKVTLDDILLAGRGQGSIIAEKEPALASAQNKLTDLIDTQWLLPSKVTTHSPKAGLNPLVDIAGYLFSLLGKLKHLKSHNNLNKLQKDLTAEINGFQETAKAKGYRSEYTLVSRYALCVTFDDIIANTPWGGQGQWDNYSLLTVFNSEAAQQERFFLILERIIKEPALYIDVMEFMYICLSLGYKGSYRSTELSNNQLEKITHGLYKRIRAYHGDFSRTLSPFSVKSLARPKVAPKKPSYWLIFSVTTIIILLLFIGLGSMLDTISNHAYQSLMHIGKSILYETQSN
jgi:type VI secretion system protein ImpK